MEIIDTDDMAEPRNAEERALGGWDIRKGLREEVGGQRAWNTGPQLKWFPFIFIEL